MLNKIFSKTETYLFLIVIVFSLAITSVNSSFLTLENMFDLMKNNAGLTILAMGVLIVLLSGGIDVSFAAVAISGEYIAANVMIRYGIDNLYTAFLISCGIGVLLGAVNGFLIAYFKLPTLITTLGTLNIFYGGLLTVMGTRAINSNELPKSFIDFSRSNIFELTKADGSVYGLSSFMIVVFGVVVVSWLILRYTMLGRGIHVIGGSTEAAWRTGLNIVGIQFFVYCYVGFLAGLMGILDVSLIRYVTPTQAIGSELKVIAAVVIGGASIYGGRGTVLGTLLGVAIIAILNTSLVMIGLSSFWNQFFIGLVIVIGVTITSIQNRLRSRRKLVFSTE